MTREAYASASTFEPLSYHIITIILTSCVPCKQNIGVQLGIFQARNCGKVTYDIVLRHVHCAWKTSYI